MSGVKLTTYRAKAICVGYETSTNTNFGPLIFNYSFSSHRDANNFLAFIKYVTATGVYLYIYACRFSTSMMQGAEKKTISTIIQISYKNAPIVDCVDSLLWRKTLGQNRSKCGTSAIRHHVSKLLRWKSTSTRAHLRFHKSLRLLSLAGLFDQLYGMQSWL